MKRIGFLYERAFTPDALLVAFQAAARHKHGKRGCFEFARRLGSNLESLHAELQSGTYRPRAYHTFMVYEPKPRRIYAPAFRDLVVQHAIYQVIRPIFEPGFIDQSFACQVGKGTHKAADYTQRALRSSFGYTLKLDVRKFFYRIDRGILRTLIERKIKDTKFVDLMMRFAEYGETVGIPIGNLLSQIYALIYLNPVDHFVKRELKVRLYCRYVDDMVAFGLSHDQAIAIRTAVISKLSTLHLELSKSTIAPACRGVNFVGYRTWRSRRFIRKHSLHACTKAAKRGQFASVVSILGHARHTSSHTHLINTLKANHHALFDRLPKTHHHLAHCGAGHAKSSRPNGAHRARDLHAAGWPHGGVLV